MAAVDGKICVQMSPELNLYVKGQRAISMWKAHHAPSDRCRFTSHMVPCNPLSYKESKGALMPKMSKSQLIDAISDATSVSKSEVKAVIESMVVVGYKELNDCGEFVIPGFAKLLVVKKPATEARQGVNPFTKEPMEIAAKPASKTIKARPLKVAKDAV
jgi:DNA-binding protein HU-beta